MNKQLLYLKIFVLSLLSTLSVAQSVEVKGKVTDEKGELLYGVNVVIKGTQQGTVSNDKGEYHIQVTKGQTLTYSYIGFDTKEVAVGDNTTIDLSLVSQSSRIE